MDETEADLHRIREMIAGTDITVETYCEKRMEMIKQGLPGDLAAIDFFGLKKTATFLSRRNASRNRLHE